MRALVTGAAGFVGGWLARELARQGTEVHGIRLGGVDDPASVGQSPVAHWHEGDIRDSSVLRDALAASTPDVIYHLAGISSLGEAEADPAASVDVNVSATVRLLNEVARSRDAGGLDPTVLIIGSSEQYGRHDPAEQPLGESAEQRPLSLYGASKAAQEVMALEEWRRRGLRVICTRSFNHTGAGQSTRFLLPALVARAVALRQSGGDLRLGNASPVRDVTHVSDVVAAYILLAEHGTPGLVYNVCSGRGSSVRDMARTVLDRVGVRGQLVEDPDLVRPVDVPVLIGDSSRLRAATGWSPLRTLDDCIEDLINAATH